MTVNELKEWLFQNSLEDQWWVAVSENTEQSPKSLSEIEKDLKLYGKMKVLHVSQAAMTNPPWVDLGLKAANAPMPPPQSSSAPTFQDAQGQDRLSKAKDHESYGTITAVSVILPWIGVIVGIVLLTKERRVDKKLGEHAIAVSILFMFIWYLVTAFLGGSPL